jgi:hypothetical protein
MSTAGEFTSGTAGEEFTPVAPNGEPLEPLVDLRLRWLREKASQALGDVLDSLSRPAKETFSRALIVEGRDSLAEFLNEINELIHIRENAHEEIQTLRQIESLLVRDFSSMLERMSAVEQLLTGLLAKTTAKQCDLVKLYCSTYRSLSLELSVVPR